MHSSKPDTLVRAEAGAPGHPVTFQWDCRDCHSYGDWTTDEAQANRDAAEHRCPDMTKAAPPGP